MYQKKVSVIIPVYNTELYLDECLESIIGQTLSDIEVICVNDGSTDKSKDILQRYANEYKNVIVISQENAGLSQTRNVGLKNASGEYIYFMDSDDKLASHALSELWQVANEKKADVVLFSGSTFYDDGAETSRDNAYFKVAYQKKAEYLRVLDGREMLAQLIENKDYTTSVCLQLIKRSFLEDIDLRFVPGILHEDNIFTFSLLMQAQRVACVNNAYFYRRIRTGSIVMQKEDHRNLYGYYHCYFSSLHVIDDQQLTDFQKDWILRIPTRLLGHVKRIWLECSEENRELFLQSCSSCERVLFKTTIEKEIHLEQKNRKEEEELIKVKKELRQIKKSVSLRIGRCITKIPRKLIFIINQIKNTDRK